MNQKFCQFLLCSSLLCVCAIFSSNLRADSNKGWCAELGMTNLSPISTVKGIIGSSSDVPVTTAALNGELIAIGGSFSGAGRSVSVYNRFTQTWDTLDGGVSGYVTALLFHDEDLYVGGYFTRAGSIEAQNIARWNIRERKWYALKTGLKGVVSCLCWYKDELYVGGTLTSADTVAVRNICRWNGSVWRAVGKGADNGVSGLGAQVKCLCVYDNKLVVGGNFNAVGLDTTLIRAAFWDGTHWSSLPNKLVICTSDAWDVSVSGLSVVSNLLILEGSFKIVRDDSSEISRPRSLVFNGSRWQGVDESYPGSRLINSRNGTWPRGFTRIGRTSNLQTTSFQLEYYDLAARQWILVDSLFANNGLGPGYGCIVADDSTILISGRYTTVGSQPIANLSLYDIKSRRFRDLNKSTSFGTPSDRLLSATSSFFFSDADTLFLAGTFLSAGDVAANGVAKWAGAKEERWLACGPGFYSNIKGKLLGPKIYLISYLNCGVIFQSKMLIGGNFEVVDSTKVENILQYDRQISTSFNGGVTQAVGTNYNSQVKCMKVIGNSLYVGGAFINAGTKAVNSICKWSNGEWLSLAGGMKPYSSKYEPVVYDIAEGPNNTVFAAGTFKHVSDTIRCSGLAQWDGVSWKGIGVDTRDSIGSVSCVVVHESDVYIAGSFHTRGAKVVNSVARWDGSQWTDLDGGIVGDGYINSMAWVNDRLIVAGSFSAIGDVAASNIAAWNAKTKRWTNLGDGINGEVKQVFVFHDSVFCSGVFTRAGDIVCTNIAVWSDQLASPVSENVYEDTALLASPNPCSARVHLRYAAGTSHIDELKVFSSFGELLYSRDNVQSPLQEADLRIDTQSYPPGCYSCVIRTRDQQIIHCRFVKQ